MSKIERHKVNGYMKKKGTGNTSALFVRTMDIIGISVRGAD